MKYDAPDPITKARVAMLYGGWSDEREISRNSAMSCHEALEEASFTSIADLDVADPEFILNLRNGSFDVAFIAMHGAYGEDGAIQGLLEIMHIPYTFSGVSGASAAIHKDVAKELYRGAGLNVPVGTCLTRDDIEAVKVGGREAERILDTIIQTYQLPYFVKPCVNGSSFGITKVKKPEQLKEAIIVAGQTGSKVLIEEAVEGTEVTAPVIGNDDPQALPLIQIKTGNAEFYDNTVKYEPPEDHHVIPAEIPQGVYEAVQRDAIRARQAVGCLGASRADFIVKADGTPVILETNVIPGMTKTSLLPDSARHVGISFPELCTKFIEWAFDKTYPSQ